MLALDTFEYADYLAEQAGYRTEKLVTPAEMKAVHPEINYDTKENIFTDDYIRVNLVYFKAKKK